MQFGDDEFDCVCDHWIESLLKHKLGNEKKKKKKKKKK